MADSPNKLVQFWQELKRRKVLRVITVYAAVAFVILQLVEILAPSLRLPDWTMNLILVLLIVGFIITVIVSWVYDATPEGIVKTEPAHKVKEVDKPVTSKSWKIASYIGIVVIVALIVLNIIPRTNRSGTKAKSNLSRFVGFDIGYRYLRGMYASILLIFLSSLPIGLLGQGPGKAYYYYPEVELSWASCNIYFDGGSQMKVPFLPVICFKIAPMGTDQYSRDIDISAPVVFIGNGISGEDYDCYKDQDVEDKFVMFFYDFPDTVHADPETGTSLVEMIDDAVHKHVAGIVLISWEDPNPFLVYNKQDFDSIPEIPVITINMKTAEKILMSSRINPDEMLDEWYKGVFTSRELICKMSLKMVGDFKRIETNDFEFCFRDDYISKNEMEEIIKVNQKSVDFILELFKEAGFEWKKIFSCYFRDYDVKLFYTHHWGRGLSSARLGNFYVHDNEIPDYGLAVHENTHTLLYQNWGEAISFFDEGIAMYAEAMAEEKDQNHNKVIQFLKEGELVHLDEMLDFNIGSGDKPTRIGYPASGSFIHFLVESYGLSKLRNIYVGNPGEKQNNMHYTLENTYKKTPKQLEEEWLKWLQKKSGFDKHMITEHFSK